jgi:hypothetical protein
MAYRRATRTYSRARKSSRTSSARRNYRSAPRASKARKSRASTKQRSAPAQRLIIRLEHAPAETTTMSRPAGAGEVQAPRKSKF